MSGKNLFRCLVAISLFCSLAATAVPQLATDAPPDWSAVFEWNGNGGYWEDLEANRWLLLGLGIPFVILAARPAYAAVVAIMVLSTPFAGLVVQLPIEATWWSLTGIVDGAIIALSYSQPFSSYFEHGSA
ncbi:MAG TPA: hypothetical protein VNC62_06960 [Burkholderiales bacterium]|jgi:hypothetical protein|nr:hypothetical protein [Burkholderiales bacterium]